MRDRLLAALGVLVLTAAFPSPARAHLIVITDSVSGDVENILFNEAGLVGTGLTITGITNETDTLFTFTEDSEAVTTPSNGAARISGTGTDGLFDSLFFAPDDALLAFRLFEANVNVTGTPTLRITATGSEVVTFDFLAGNGENRFGVYTLLDQYIASVLIQSLNGDAISDVRQIRVGGVGSFDATDPDALTSVPEPGALVLFGSGLIALGWQARRRLRP